MSPKESPFELLQPAQAGHIEGLLLRPLFAPLKEAPFEAPSLGTNHYVIQSLRYSTIRWPPIGDESRRILSSLCTLSSPSFSPRSNAKRPAQGRASRHPPTHGPRTESPPPDLLLWSSLREAFLRRPAPPALPVIRRSKTPARIGEESRPNLLLRTSSSCLLSEKHS